MILRNVFGIGFGLAVVFAASAHEAPLPPLCKNPRSQQVMIGAFSFTEAELAAYAEKRSHERPGYCPLPAGLGRRDGTPDGQDGGSGASPQGRCGIVDAYHDATEYIYVYCRKISGQQEQPTFRVTTPASYNAPSHHQTYRFSDAPLRGSCYVCRIPKRMDSSTK